MHTKFQIILSRFGPPKVPKTPKKPPFCPIFRAGAAPEVVLGDFFFWEGKWKSNEKIKAFFESILDKISNELSWSSFGHREGLQSSVARRPNFLVQGLRPWPWRCTLAYKVKKRHKFMEKDIFEDF